MVLATSVPVRVQVQEVINALTMLPGIYYAVTWPTWGMCRMANWALALFTGCSMTYHIVLATRGWRRWAFNIDLGSQFLCAAALSLGGGRGSYMICIVLLLGLSVFARNKRIPIACSAIAICITSGIHWNSCMLWLAAFTCYGLSKKGGYWIVLHSVFHALAMPAIDVVAQRMICFGKN